MADSPRHGPQRGRYANDPRVTRDGRPGYVIPDPSGDGDDWRVKSHTYYGGWTASSEHGQVAMDPTDRHNRRLQLFDSADDAIGYVIGDPQDGTDG